ncbi:unnamed protein product [Ceutorhynchus assimilis]|uniref:GH18 domain-containing protein n=1 Tax=Ceutorhynchus assimilis TaxID=467358 RepID=A0A9N9MZD8_9CUCU|nr:unnamed protein product [Ceutorhynchus assimilis]
MNIIFFVLLVAFLSQRSYVKGAECDSKAEIVCYFGSWAIYRTYEGRFTTEQIDPKLCTNIIYSFAGLNMDLLIDSLDYNADITLGGFANVSAFKQENPCVKTTIAIGGWNEGSLKYSIMASTEDLRQKFADSVIKFIVHYGFDGVDLDWEYPTARGGIPADKSSFVALLKTLKARLSPWGFRLTIAVGIDDSYYDIENIADYVDYVHLMAYDLITANSNVTGLLAPLSIIKEKINIWLTKGLPKSKLILGVPTYARCFNLEDSKNHAIGAPVTTTTCGGAWTDEDGFLAYYEVAEMVNNRCQGTEISDDNVYSWCGDIWMSYDNVQTVQTKTQYVLDQGLGGVMIWSLDTDDFNGMYGDKYALLSSIYKTINA